MKFMRKLVSVAMLGLLLGSFFDGLQPVRAISYTADVYKTGYYNNLISDEEFLNINSMTVGDIQNYLVRNNSYLQYYQENGRFAAQIIWDAAHGATVDSRGTLNGIVVDQNTGTVNPMVILVTLQKEQSLITRTTRSDSALTWAMGYGCLENGTRNPNLAGFAKQVDWAAWQLRYNFHRAESERTWATNYKVGQTMRFSDWTGSYNVTFANRATASLYRYTPHVFNGNFNFWRMYHDSGQLLVGSINPYVKKSDPLLEAVTGVLTFKKDLENNIYLIDTGNKYLLKDAQTATDWGVDPGMITDLISDETDGGMIGNLIKLAGTDTIYRISAGKRQFFETADSMMAYGYLAQDAVELPGSMLQALVKGESLGQLVKKADNETIYYLDVLKVAYPFASKSVFLNAGFDDDDIRIISDGDFAKFTLGEVISAAGKTADSPIYLLVNGYKRQYSSFDDVARSGQSVSNVTLNFLSLFTAGPMVSFPAFVAQPVVVPVVKAAASTPTPEVRYKYVTKCSYVTKIVKKKKKRVKVCSKVKVAMKKVTLYKYKYVKTCTVKKVKGKNKKVCSTKRVKVPYTVWR